jgi:DNA-binding NarL/FixJ family response regulator
MKKRAPRKLKLRMKLTDMTKLDFNYDELTILGMLVRGATDAEIAQHLDWELKVTNNFMRKLKRKAGYANRTQLAVWWWTQTRNVAA